MRITQNSMHRTQLAGLNGSLARLQKTQEELTTGKRLNRPSDDPVGTVSAMRMRGDQRQLEQFGDNIQDGVDRLGTAGNALMSASPMFQRIRTLLVSSLNGTNGPAQLAANAEEIGQLKDALKQVANTQHAGRPVFGGTAYDPSNDNAFDPASGAWKGNSLPVLRKITSAPGDAGTIDVSVDGSKAFGTDLFVAGKGIDAMVTALKTGDRAGMQAALSAVDDQMKQLNSVQATIGAKVNRLTNLQDINGRQADATLGALSKVEDTDFMKAAMDLNIQSTAYQAALNASAKIVQQSLADFIR